MARGQQRARRENEAGGTAEEQTDGRKEGRKIQFSRQRDTTDRERERERHHMTKVLSRNGIFNFAPFI